MKPKNKNKIKIKYMLWFNDKPFKIGDIVQVKDMYIADTLYTGKIIDIREETLYIDCSEKFNSHVSSIDFENIESIDILEEV